jgi:hypothetical protein
MPAFLDIEASGLGDHSYPIEIGWAIPFGEEGGFLIRPATGWNHWSAVAEEVFHRISRDTLLREGIHADHAVRRLEAALVRQEVYSEDPEQDGRWLGRLYRAAHEPCRVIVRDANVLFDAMRGGRDLSAIRQTVAAQFPHVHRAVPDARQLAEIWKLLSSDADRLSRR